MDNIDKEREELCERFRKDLSRPLSERFYSEEELVVIFDYAGDCFDDYLRSEALLLGARFYPDSRELLERRAIFYQDFEGSSFESFLDDNPDLQSPLWQILLLNRFVGPQEDAIARVSAFIEANHLNEDEQVIQFVQMTSRLRITQWLYDNFDLIKLKCNYLPTLYYEVAIVAELEGNNDIQVKMLLELTELEPYNADYWTMLAIAYFRSDKLDEGATALDYALAIDPNHIEALKAKLRIQDPSKKEVSEALYNKLLELAPDDADVAFNVIVHAEFDGSHRNVVKIVKKVLPLCSMSMPLAAKAIEYGQASETMLRSLYDFGATDADDWRTLAETAYRSGDFNMVATINHVFEEKNGEKLDCDLLLMRMMFKQKHYHAVINIFINDNSSQALHDSERLYEGFAMMLLSMLRLGEIEAAINAADGMLQMFEVRDSIAPGTLTEQFGIKTFLNDIIKRANAKRPTNWENYDPMGLD